MKPSLSAFEVYNSNKLARSNSNGIQKKKIKKKGFKPKIMEAINKDLVDVKTLVKPDSKNAKLSSELVTSYVKLENILPHTGGNHSSEDLSNKSSKTKRKGRPKKDAKLKAKHESVSDVHQKDKKAKRQLPSSIQSNDSESSKTNKRKKQMVKTTLNPETDKLSPEYSTANDFSAMFLEAFYYVVSPLNSKQFFENYWEMHPLHITRHKSNYYKEFFSSSKLDEMLRHNPLYYTRNVDIVTYENGERQTHNPEGRAVPSSVWDYYSNGCSVRVLNPQTYNEKIRTLLAALQEYFGTMVGANVYLTPPGSQGFAPHYDDIEAFVLQIEGRKHWKIYEPKENKELPRYSSKNFKRDELNEPEEVTLEAGDFLYFPRGYIHEARTDDDMHSLHITISVYQNTAYVDLIEKVLMDGLRKACDENPEFRRGLPIQYLKHVGIVNSDKKSSIRNEIIATVKNLVNKLPDYVSVDDGADQLGRKFMYDSLPPQLLPEEKLRSSQEDGDVLKHGVVTNRGTFDPDTKIRLVRYHAIRVVKENEIYRIYYNTENANVYHGEDEQFLEIDETIVDAIKLIVDVYPQYLKIENLPCADQVCLLQAISDLWERGLIITRHPLNVYD